MSATAQSPLKPEYSVRHWRPVPDDVYLQEVGRAIPTELPVLGVEIIGRDSAGRAARLLIMMDDGVHSLGMASGEIQNVGVLDSSFRRSNVLDGVPWILAEQALYTIRDERLTPFAQGNYPDICMLGGDIVVAAPDRLFRVKGDTLEPISGSENPPHPIERMAAHAETLYIVGGGSLFLFDGRGYVEKDAIEWGTFPTAPVRDILSIGSRLAVATSSGLGVQRGTTITSVTGADGLPYEDLRCLANGLGNDMWLGTSHGAIRAVDGEYQVFGARRWLPNERVNDIAVSGKEVFIATDGGIGIIKYEPYTLLKKAAYYERHLEEWGQKRLGFVHKLEWNDAEKEWVREISDNDAGWSTHYLTAQCFKYAVTGNEGARLEAVNFFNSLKWTEEISSILGFPARSVWAKGEKGHQAMHGSGGFDAEWHDSPDGNWEWKGDTSSDEIDSHIYATSIFYELVAQGDEKDRAREHLDRIASHIAEHGWTLCDVDGKPARWGRWDPGYFNSPMGAYARGLNGLEVLSYMKTAAAVTGMSRHEEAYAQLVEMGYPEYTLTQKHTSPAGRVNHSDDRLAFYVYLPILAYERDPRLRSIYLRSIERSWEIERIETNPWFNFIYGAMTGNDCETSQAVAHLREWPLDMVHHPYKNSDRLDITTPEGYTAYTGEPRVFSPRERGPVRWSDNPFQLDGGGGRDVVDPSGWLDAYWMGRYYGFIEAPTATDPEVLTVERRDVVLGAKPYDGPPRP